MKFCLSILFLTGLLLAGCVTDDPRDPPVPTFNQIKNLPAPPTSLNSLPYLPQDIPANNHPYFAIFAALGKTERGALIACQLEVDAQDFPHRVIETSCKKIDDNFMAQMEAEYLLPNQEEEKQFEYAPPVRDSQKFL